MDFYAAQVDSNASQAHHFITSACASLPFAVCTHSNMPAEFKLASSKKSTMLSGVSVSSNVLSAGLELSIAVREADT